MAISMSLPTRPEHLLSPFAFKALILAVVSLAVIASWWVVWKAAKARGEGVRWGLPVPLASVIPATFFILGFLV